MVGRNADIMLAMLTKKINAFSKKKNAFLIDAASMPGVIRLVMKDSKSAVDLLCGNHSSKFVRQGQGTETPAQRGFHFIERLVCEAIRTADHDLKGVGARIHAFLKLLSYIF